MGEAELNAEQKIYVGNVRKYFELYGHGDFSQMKDEEIIPFIKERSKKYLAIQKENNELLSELVFKYKDKGSLISAEQEKDLENFGDVLFKSLSPYEYAIALELYHICYDYAKTTDDESLIVRTIYKYGIASYNASIETGDDEHRIFEEVKKYFGHYEQLSKDSRAYFCRALGNTIIGFSSNYVIDHYREIMTGGEKVLAFFKEQQEKGIDKDFPWDNWEFVTKKNITTVTLAFRERDDVPQEDKDEIVFYAKQVFDKGEMIYKTASPVYALSVYSYFTNLYSAGKISLKQLIYRLDELRNSKPGDDSQVDLAFRKINITAFIIDYYLRYSPDTDDKKRAFLKPYIDDTLIYISKLGNVKADQTVRKAVVAFLKAAMNNISYGEIKDQIFEIAVTYHLPTYVHSLMVEELSALIAQEMIKVNPSYFVGSLGMNSAADVLEKKDKLILDLREAARFHDIGKYFCMIQVSDCYRALTKEEFELVKMHPINGYHAFFYGDISPNPMMKDVILFHHIYYNGQSGYPLSNHEDQEDKEDKKIVDIVTIADSLDAGTDDIGRAFTKGKTILQLIEELKAGEGSRYSPEVLSLFDNPELMDSIREALDVKRKEIYLKCYRNVKQG